MQHASCSIISQNSLFCIGFVEAKTACPKQRGEIVEPFGVADERLFYVSAPMIVNLRYRRRSLRMYSLEIR